VNDELAGLSDAELARLANDGDIRAFEEIYDRHASGVGRALASFAGPDEDVLDDLTQEVFLRVINGLPSYVPIRPFAHWLYTIALNVGRNHVRGRRTVVFVDTDEMRNVAAAGNAVKTLPEEIVAKALMRLASRLPEHLLDVVSLRIGSGMPYGEIGEVLGIPEGTARSRMHSAVRILREKIGLETQGQGGKRGEE